jgi:hypothetical protein
MVVCLEPDADLLLVSHDCSSLRSSQTVGPPAAAEDPC